MAANASLVMVEQFSASNFWKQVKQYNVTCLILHMGVVDILKNRPPHEWEPNHSVRVGFRIDAAFMKKLHIPAALVGYGSTEAGGLVTMNRYRWPLTAEEESLPYLSNVCGKPRDDMEVMIADEEGDPLPTGQVGEILVWPKNPHVIFDGYYNEPQKTLESFKNFWFHTGIWGSGTSMGTFVSCSGKKRAFECGASGSLFKTSKR